MFPSLPITRPTDSGLADLPSPDHNHREKSVTTYLRTDSTRFRIPGDFARHGRRFTSIKEQSLPPISFGTLSLRSTIDWILYRNPNPLQDQDKSSCLQGVAMARNSQ